MDALKQIRVALVNDPSIVSFRIHPATMMYIQDSMSTSAVAQEFPIEPLSQVTLAGRDVTQDANVPQGEIWLQDANGKHKSSISITSGQQIRSTIE